MNPEALQQLAKYMDCLIEMDLHAKRIATEISATNETLV